VTSAEPAAFDDDDVQSLDLMAGTVAAALGRQMAFDARSHGEARLRAMLEHAHDAVVSVDGEGRVSQWNRAAERLFGWSPIEAMGQPLADLIVPSALRGEFARIVGGFADSGSLEQVHQRVGVPAVDRAGRELAIEMSLTATRVRGRWELTAFGHDVSQRRQLEGQLREMALCDGLTGLANRRAFMESLEKAVSRSRRHGHSMALLFMDLDRFKQINDHFGHHVGDQALRAFAQRLACCVRKGDTVARLGGDEFTVLAEGIESAAQAEAMAHKIVAALRAPLDIHGVLLHTSIGISLYREPADASTFLRQADRAMYLAKHHGAGREGVATYVSIEALLD
jgi:diguanylate cyclase (GGDEF)-like protein/PAS domain S-box-containing protein